MSSLTSVCRVLIEYGTVGIEPPRVSWRLLHACLEKRVLYNEAIAWPEPLEMAA
jgi:hypothetical protein